MMMDSSSQSITDLAVSLGTAVPNAGNLPLELDDPDSVWFVESGAVDIFIVERKNGVEQTALELLMRAEAGRLLPGVAPQSGETTLSLVAKGLSGTILRRLSVDDLALVDRAELVKLVDTWIIDLSAALSRDIIYPPTPDILVEAGHPPMEAGKTFSARRGVVWVQVPESLPNVGLFMDLIEVDAGFLSDDPTTDVLPITSDSWLKLTTAQQFPAILSSKTLADDGRLLPALNLFHKLVLDTEQINRMLTVVDQANLERASTAVRRVEEDRARRQLFSVPGLSKRTGVEDGDPALAIALQVIGRREGIKFKWPTRTESPEIPPDLVDILNVSGVRGRKVRLDGMNRWWMGDSGAMLAFRADDGEPVALLPGGLLGRYRIFDPATGQSTQVTAERADSLMDEAWLFYRPLEPTALRPIDLIKIFSNKVSASLARFAAAGLASSLIMLVSVVALGFVVNRVIPTGDLSLLYTVTAGLAAFAAIWALIHILQGMALMRIEGYVASRLEAAFWDRLLRLPLNFLHRYPSANRAMRGMAFQRLRNTIQGVAANNVLSIIFLLPVLVVIFFYDAILGGITAASGLLFLVVTLVLGLRQVSPYERMIRASHRLTGVLFQFINGISKLRIDGAEGSAYAVWARHYGEQQRAELELGAWDARLRAFGNALPLLAGAVVLAAVSSRGPETFAVGEFLIIYTAFLLFVSGVVRLGNSFAAVAAVAPELAQIRPFLAEPPETSGGQEPVEDLGGNLIFDHVSFRYDPAGPLILDDVSIRARRGEFIAIAGESGSGKSTLFRIALGLNEPTTGTVYYDRRDLRQLNVKQVRKKIGVVPQKTGLHPQDLWDNIAADTENIDANTVWHAAKNAFIAEEISNMPMQMLTCVGDSQSVMSGGETQRIMIARALARDPRILLLDEATNFLDNDSQSKVMNQLAQLPMTRIVIAHRLSTLVQADRIYVMQSGKVVEQGTFDELIATEGVFRELVRRQET